MAAKRAIATAHKMMVWHNGEWKEEGEAAVAADDGALLRGEGVFETLLGLGGKVFELERHWKRLGVGCDRFGIGLGEVAQGREICEELLLRNGLTQAGQRVRVRVTRTPANWIFTAEAGSSYPDELVLLTSPFTRNEGSSLVGLKAISYGENTLALEEGRGRGADEVLIANTKGDWCEGAWSNVFAVVGGRLLTPPLSSGCLPGVTRELTIELAREEGIEVLEVALPMNRVGEGEELFLTSSLLGLGAIRKFDGRDFAEGSVTCRLRELLSEREASRG